MAKNENKGLGRGLNALISLNDMDFSEETANLPKDAAASGTAVEIEIRDIDPNSEQPRKHFDQEALNELADSIKIHGVIQPIVLNKMGSRYMIIAGERRFRAAKLAGLVTVPAVIKNYSPQEIREISLIENLQREDLNPIEAARAIKALIEEFRLTQEAAASRIGKNRSTVTNTLRLLTLDAKVIEMVENNRLTSGHARALITLPDKNDQRRIAFRIEQEGLSVRETEKLIRDILNPPPPLQKNTRDESLELRELVGNMQRVFATKVTAQGTQDKGKIQIDYFSRDDLDRLVEMVNKWLSENMPKSKD